MNDEYDEDDPTNPGRGLANGILLSIVMWAVIYGLYKVFS
jgi:hypothetical protein